MTFKFFRENYLLLLILLIGVFFRFFNYSDRVGFGQDSGRDAIIALESIRNHKLPLLGPPSSAWGFNFGPLYYYFIIFFTLVIPSIFAPWLGFTLLSVLTIFLVYKTGESVFDKRLGLIAAFLCAISFGEVANSANLLNTQLVSFATALAFFSLAKTLKEKSRIFPVLLGFAVALAINCHFQASSLFLLLPLAVLFAPGKVSRKLNVLLFAALGFLLSFTPIFIFELQHNFAWIKSVIDYSLHGQQKFYVPVRWLTEITVFWPGIFGRVMSGHIPIGYFYSGLILISFVLSLVKKVRLPKFFCIILFTFLLEVLSVRYYKGTRSSEYFIITHQFVLFFLSFALWMLTKVNRYLGGVIILFISFVTFKNDISLLHMRSNAPDVLGLFNQERQFVGKGKVRLHGTANSWGSSIAIYYLSQKESLIGETGEKYIICDNLEGSTKGLPEYCPKENRLLVFGRLVIFPYEKFTESQRESYQIEELRGDIYYNRTYDNYELRH